MILWFNLFILSGLLSLFLASSSSKRRKTGININKIPHFIFCVGICVAFASNLSFDLLAYSLFNYDESDTDCVIEDYSELGEKNNCKIFEDKHRVWFVTVTRFSMVQDALLTKIGQALFPMRGSVVWVIVKHEDPEEITKPSISYITTKAVLETVRRFGIPFVFLQSKRLLVAENEDQYNADAFRQTFLQKTYPTVAGIQTGLKWIQQNVERGVLVLADEDFTFNYHLFQEVKNTEKVIAWPVGLPQKDLFYAPVTDNKEINGYFDDVGLHIRMKILQGGFAINIEYLKTLEEFHLWKLTYDDFYNFDFAGIPMLHIKPLKQSDDKIYVWRTVTSRKPWPKPNSIKLKKDQEKSNIRTVLLNLFKYKYSNFVSVKEDKVKQKLGKRKRIVTDHKL